ncbi:hypothetical protein JN535_04245 [Cellulosimicrobium cellulans]|uniref:hypothetical protein n=1 Tax=Cellulosimicrobium cellulans TaxID=1710 RepID=UPI0019625D18|nr:hypothetical protein [Cellulosimicrobium cellulans]MBN0039385.1 hypothetical protein [Cellulosimicrobium cellulans]
MDQGIRPTGTLRAWGWPLLAAGILVLLIVWPLFTIGAATSASDAPGTGLVFFVARVAPFLGVALVAGAITLLVMASKRAAANREATQAAQLAALQAQVRGHSSDSV